VVAPDRMPADAGARGRQQAKLGAGEIAGADEHHDAASQIKEYGQILHRCFRLQELAS
jgi:hypothetical protein